jgi:hypothetical protein
MSDIGAIILIVPTLVLLSHTKRTDPCEYLRLFVVLAASRLLSLSTESARTTVVTQLKQKGAHEGVLKLMAALWYDCGKYCHERTSLRDVSFAVPAKATFPLRFGNA